MWNASIKGQCAADSSGAAATITVNAGEVKLKAALSEANFEVGPSFSNLSLSLEKPASFIIDYHVPKQVISYLSISSFQKNNNFIKVIFFFFFYFGVAGFEVSIYELN